MREQSRAHIAWTVLTILIVGGGGVGFVFSLVWLLGRI